MIKVENLSRYYDDFLAVDNVSFNIKKGQIVGLLGHNGAGKTTIMKMLTTILEPSSGNITINDINIKKDPKEIKKYIGYLPENCPTYQDFTVIEYLLFLGELKGLVGDKLNNALKKAIESTNIKDRILSPINTLSKGLKQRVGLASAILGEPPILILDEPTNGLDPSQIQETRRLIKKLSETSTVILSTHIMQEVEAICERALIISNGKLIKDETLENLTKADSIIIKTHYSEKFFKELTKTIKIEREIIILDESPDFFKCRIYTPNTSNADLEKISKLLSNMNLPIFEIYAKENSLDNIFKEVVK
ncbi:MAG: ABC transporter ATP-binding protein [Bdellovibrionota bacterium]